MAGQATWRRRVVAGEYRGWDEGTVGVLKDRVKPAKAGSLGFRIYHECATQIIPQSPKTSH
jgi:hypothetical protein